jgi:hypothetical protein
MFAAGKPLPQKLAALQINFIKKEDLDADKRSV